jgi:hypothetical protein
MKSLLSFFSHNFFKILLALYVGVFLLIWLISSPVAKHFITPILAEQKLHLSDGASIRFNPFLMRLTLSDINLSTTKDSKADTVLVLEKLHIQVALWQLAFDKIVLSEFLLNQGSLKVTQHDGHLVVAGIEIAASEPKAEQTTEEVTELPNEEDVNTPTSDFPYQLILPELVLNQFHIEIERDTQQQKNKTHHITIEQLVLSDIKATQIEQQGKLSLAALIDETQLALSANAQLHTGQGDIHSELNIENYPIEKLARYVEQLTQLKGSLSLNSKQTVTLAAQGVNLKVHNANVNLQEVLAGLDKQTITLQEFQHSFTDIAINLQDSKVTHLAGKSTIKLSNAALNQNESEATIAAFKQLNLADINFVLDDEPSIDITDIVLDEFLFSKRAELSQAATQKAIEKINQVNAETGLDFAAEELVKLPPVMQLKQLTLNNLHIHEKSIAINSIVLDTLTGAVIIKENKDIANLIALSDKEKQTENTEPNNTEEVVEADKEAISSKKQASHDDFIFRFNELRFINKNEMVLTDFSVEPSYQRTLFIDTLDIGALSNGKDKQQQTPFTLVGRSNKYANFDLSGYLKPFADITTYHIKGDLKEFSLPAISTYIKGSTGIEVKTGQLNTALDVTLSGDELDGNVVVLLQALETGLVDSEEAGSLIDQGALPLNMALGMLKDSDGNVELDVPLSGSTSDPQFGLSSIVTLITQKAIWSATQDYLMTTFVPYANIVSLAMTAGEFALKLRFDDLDYQVEQVEPDDKQAAYLKDFVALMQDKEDTRVTICAISTSADIGLKAGVEVSNKKDIKRLLDLGEQREHAFKDYLIEEGKIDSSRILFCKPQIDSDEGAIPRIAISV